MMSDDAPKTMSHFATKEDYWKYRAEKAEAERDALRRPSNALLRQVYAERDQLKAERDEARNALGTLVLKHGGKSAGHAYGITNCFACKSLANDYYLIGKSQLCLECFEAFPACLAVSPDTLTPMLAEVEGALKKIKDGGVSPGVLANVNAPSFDAEMLKEVLIECVSSGLDLAELEAVAISAALEVHGGNRTRTAKALGICVRTLRYKLAQEGSCSEVAVNT